MKIFFFCLFALVQLSVFAQDESDQTDSQKRLDDFTAIKKHEVSLDVTALIALPAFSPRYEYILGRYSGVGVDLFIALNNDDYDYEDLEKLSLTPYYRQYFFSKEDYGAKGFYAEGFLKFYTFEAEKNTFNVNDDFLTSDENFFETAIGVGIGWKWVSDSGFLIDLGFGIGRDLGLAYTDDIYYYDPEIILRGGLNFGWRF